MTSAFQPRAALRTVSRRLALLATLSASLGLVACGGGNNDSSGTTNLRALNLLTDVSSADLYTGDTKRFSALASDTIAPQISFDANTYSLVVKRAGDATALFTGSYSLAKDLHYTAILWGRETAMRVSTLPEDENSNDVSVGVTRVRMLNATIDSGTVDIYLTTPEADITAGITPAQAGLTAGTLAAFRDVSTGTYRLRVTAAGDPTDVRADVPSVTFGDRQFTTIVLTAGAGGALLNATTVQQGGPATSYKNTKARVRLAASVDNSGLINATLNGSPLFTAYRSPRPGAYQLVEAGTRTLGMTVNGTAVPAARLPGGTATQTLLNGADYTLLAFGPPATAQVNLFTDDNRVPSTVNRAKVRLINGVAGSDPMTAAVDYQFYSAITDVVAGSASGYATPTTTGSSRVDVTSSSSNPLFSVTSTNSTVALLSSQGVYTVFILSGQTAPSGRLIRDR